jgi:RHS repeat-associated protein
MKLSLISVTGEKYKIREINSNFLVSEIIDAGTGLGSQAMVADANGGKISEVRYYPWGEDRYSAYTTSNTYRYTGQRAEFGSGLYYYGARWYDPTLGRFVQADTIVPGGVQGLDRYAYTFNNPLKYTDPSGHDICDADGNCNNNESIEASLYRYGIFIEAKMKERDKLQILIEASSMGTVLSCIKGNCSSFNTESDFREVMGDVQIRSDDNVGNYCEVGNSGITCHSGTTGKIGDYGFAGTIIHEYGHILDDRLGGAGTNLMNDNGIYDKYGNWVSGIKADGTYERTGTGYRCPNSPCMMHSLDWLPDGPTPFEEFADMWMNYVQNSFASNINLIQNSAGEARYQFMQQNLGALFNHK